MSLISTLLAPPPTPNRPALPSTGKAGRNLPAALGVAAVLVAIVVLPLMINPVLFVPVVVLAVWGALWELAGACARAGVRLPLAPLYVGAAGIAVCAWQIGAEAALGAYLATVGACLLWSFLDQAEADWGTPLEHASHDMPRTTLHDAARRSRSMNATVSVFAATYIPLMAGFAVLLASQDHGVGKVLTMIALPAANDTGGWLVGIFFGKHPMAPRVSPKKSWEGAAGSLVSAMLVGMLCLWLLDAPLWAGALLGAIAMIVCTLGDLGESLLKRDLGLKDMGTLLPGHGGLMDRLDSILVIAPVVYLFSLLIL